MRTESDTPRELLDAVGSEPVLKACALVGHAFGIEVRGNPGRDRGPRLRGAGRGDRRVVGLPHAAGHAARRLVELRPRSAARPARRDARCRWRCCRRAHRSYEYINPKTGERGKVNAKIGETLTPFGFTFYRPFPDGSLTVRQVDRLRRARARQRHQVAAVHRDRHRHVRLGDAVLHRQDLRRGGAAGRPRDAVRVRRRADVLGARHRGVQVRAGRDDDPHPVADAEQRPGGGLGSPAQPAGQLLPQVRGRRPVRSRQRHRSDPGADRRRRRRRDPRLAVRPVLRGPDDGLQRHAGAGGDRPDVRLRGDQHDRQLPAAALPAAGDPVPRRHRRPRPQPDQRRLEAAHRRRREPRLQGVGARVRRSSARSASPSATSRTSPASSAPASRCCRRSPSSR